MSMIEFLTEKKFAVSSHLIEIAVNEKISLTEFLLLMYFEDVTDKTFDVLKMSRTLSLKEADILNAFNKLLNLNLIKMDVKKDEANKIREVVSLVPLYDKIVEEAKKVEQKNIKQDVFALIEKEFSRKITPMEYEIVNAWILKGFSEDLIGAALKEAIYNGVKTFRYIDKILYEWQKKGYKTEVDVRKGNIDDSKNKSIELFDYNWLDEE